MTIDNVSSKSRKAVTTLVCHLVRIVVLVLVAVTVIVPVHNNNNNNNNNNESRTTTLALSFGGFCARCQTHHVLPTTNEAKQAALDLRNRMIRSGRIDIDELPAEQQKRLLSLASDGKDEENENGEEEYMLMDLDPALATARLYERRGKMFGVLVCEAPRNNNNNNNSNNSTLGSESNTNPNPHDVVILKAYAGKLGGQWNLPGWAPLVGKVPESIPEFRQLSAEVTDLFEKIDSLSLSEDEEGTTVATDLEKSAKQIQIQIEELTKERSRKSTLCIEELRRHQVLKNFRGIRMPIKEAFAKGPTKLPGGTGDCAAPKLIARAVRLELRPIGICEIFVGATGGMSTTKGDGEFYDACEPRCQQIAGHMLCGLDIPSRRTNDGRNDP